MKTLLSSADILYPPYLPTSAEWEKWAVIACDQFTGEPEYWKNAEKITENALTTLDYILPEAYLGSEKEPIHTAKIAASMKTAKYTLSERKNCMVYVERTLPDGKLRRGLVGKIDLEEYDFTPSSSSAVRATEQTVTERIPPRVKVRREATVELPHVMLFAGAGCSFIDHLQSIKDELPLIYKTPLMLGGGAVEGRAVEGKTLESLLEMISSYEKTAKGFAYAVGDGNHSLAGAKAYWEELKKNGADKENSPARYALAEVVPVTEASIEFEPIYRVVENCGVTEFLSFVENAPKVSEKPTQTVTAVTENGEKRIEIGKTYPLTVGTLQDIIDSYIKSHPQAKCDYIHGETSLRNIAGNAKTVGFLFDGMKKEELFDAVAASGTLPRKTFSMGSAQSKRYYLEARAIK